VPDRPPAEYQHLDDGQPQSLKRRALLPTSKSMPASGRGNSLHLSLEASEHRYRRLFETAQDGILILDGETGKIMDANPYLLDLLNYPFETLMGLQLWEIGQFRDITANQKAFEDLKENEYIRYENLPLRTKSGKHVHVEVVSNVYFVDSRKVIQCNVRDITDRAEAQAASQKHLTTLELAGQAKDEVIAVLSHELRTPLTAITSMIDLIEMENGLIDPPESEKHAPHLNKSAVTLIRRNAQNLVRLINDLLDLNHIAKGALQLNLEAVDAHEGSLEATSEGLNRGSQFRARFKVDDSLFGRRLEMREADPNSTTGLRVLLVEDNEESRLCVSFLLESEGYLVQVAKDIRSALGLQKDHAFDLLITDVGLPDGNGRDLLEKLRATTPHIEGIAVSGYGSPQDILKTKAAGFLAHLVKPVAFPKLHTAIRTLYSQAKEPAERQMEA
jgi:PAS domain S-box-containing protein